MLLYWRCRFNYRSIDVHMALCHEDMYFEGKSSLVATVYEYAYVTLYRLYRFALNISFVVESLQGKLVSTKHSIQL